MSSKIKTAERRDKLSPAKQALLQKRLRGEFSDDAELSNIPKRARQEAARLSFSQQRMWFMDRLEPDNPAYNISVAYRLTGPLDISALEQSFNEIVRRHEILRTSFAMRAGAPVQIVNPVQPFSPAIVDLSDLPANEREEQARCLAATETRRPFDLSRGPLLRANLLKLDDELHILLYVAHHIAADGWSIGLIDRELAAHYTAFSSGQPSPLSELPLQYADFAGWQRQWLQGEKLENQLDYWKQQLSGISTLQLPTERPRPAVQTYRGAHNSLLLPPTLAQKLNALSRREGATLFMTLLAAFQTLLCRYTGQTDITLGSPTAGRNRSEIEGLIGHFTNNLTLRTDLSGNPTFRTLLGRVRETTLDAYANQDIPFEKLVETLQPERDLSLTPLFQVMFNLRNASHQPLMLPGLQAETFAFETGVTALDLNVELTEKSEGLHCTFIYNTDLFEAATIGRMAGHFHTLLAGIAANPDSHISNLPLLTGAEARQLLAWNNTFPPRSSRSQTEFGNEKNEEAEWLQGGSPLDSNIAALFEAQAERTPEAAAFIFAGQTLTYRELNRRANQLAHYLQTPGVGPSTVLKPRTELAEVTGPEIIVGLYLERSPEMVVGLLAILKAGGIYLPLDPAYPPERLAFMIKDSGASVLLSQSRFAPLLPATEAQVIFLDTEGKVIAQQSKENPPGNTSAGSPAYVLYTSGSTGKPKGVVGLHRGAINRFAWMWRAHPFAAGEICCVKTALSFVDSVWELFGPLLQGVTSVIIPDEVVQDPNQLVDTLETHQITRIVLVPSLLQLILDSQPDLQRRLPKLKLWISSGETLPVELCRQFKQTMPHGKLLNLYGSSEVAADVSWYDTDQLPDQSSNVPIGRPIANTQLYILDANLQPVPIGIPGQLHVGGVGLAREYLNRPKLTAEKFIKTPQAGGDGGRPSIFPGSRLFKTGDLARYLPDGNIEFLGRLDHQVKIRGRRIELGEIETALRQHPDVQAGAVLLQKDKSGTPRLAACFVPAGERIPDSGELKRFLRQKLPAWMIPSALVKLDAFPLTPNGKLDRRALPPLEKTRDGLEKTFVAPRNPLERDLGKIWADVLDIPAVGVQDNFFDLGGHSLLAVRLFAEMEKITGQSLPLATLFQSPTIEQLAIKLQQKGWQPPWRSLVAIQPDGANPPFFCVHGLGGNVVSFDNLARYLGPEQPFYGLQAAGLNEKDDTLHTTIEEMAAHYVAEIRTVQPEGPYFLGGLCFGGAVAYEMAQQLAAGGQPAALLVLIDTPLLSRAVRSQISVWQRARLHWRNLSRLSSPEKRGYLRKLAKRKWQETSRAAKLAVKRLAGKNAVDLKAPAQLTAQHSRLLANMYKDYPKLGLEIPTGARRMWAVNQLAQQFYLPHAYPGKVTLFQNEKQKERFVDPHLRWGRLAKGGIAQYGVPGDHLALLQEPHIRVLAETLKRCINQVAGSR